MLAAFGGILVPLAASCGGGDRASHPADSGAVTLEVFPGDFVEEGSPLKMLAEGDGLQLVAAPQGGHVAHVGAKVRGLSSSVVTLRARLRDPVTDAVRAEEARDVVMKPVPEQPDLMQPDLESVSQVTHIPACPDYEATDLVDQPFVLEVSVREVGGPGAGSATLGIVLACQQSDPAAQARCRCECAANYTLGKCSSSGPSDAGAD